MLEARFPSMLDSVHLTPYLWRVITHFGSAGLILPILTIVVIGLWQSGQRTAAGVWLIWLGLSILATVASKVLFLGWGIGVAELNFTGVSGHTVLATSVLPVFFSWVMALTPQRFNLVGALFGLGLSVGVGLSRVVLGTHSPSEVVAGWVIGLMVSAVTLYSLDGRHRRPWFASLSPLILLLALSTTTSNYLPTHDWELRLALLLSGQNQPHHRHQRLGPIPVGLHRFGYSDRVIEPVLGRSAKSANVRLPEHDRRSGSAIA
jgi:membrane-associated phospholipid phosphatase